MELLTVSRHNKEIEAAVLGMILVDSSCFELVHSIVQPDCFYISEHQAIFKAMASLAAQGTGIELLTVVNALKSRNELDVIGGPFVVAKLVNQVTSTVHAEDYARIVYQDYLSRSIVRMGMTMAADGQNPAKDPLQLAEQVHKDFESLRDKLYSGKEISFQQIVTDTVIHSLKARDNEGLDLIGLPTGSPKLDRFTGGWQAPDLIIIAARPGCGKTSLSLDLAHRLAGNGHPVGFISLEMAGRQLVTKLLSKEARLSALQIMRGNYGTDQVDRMAKAEESLSKLPIYINDRVSDIHEIRSWCYKVVRKFGVRAIFIDYLQLAGAYAPGRSRENEIAEISKQCKRMAKELDVPVFLLSQLSREAEKKQKPTLATLRESGAIEQDADQVIFIYDDPDVEFTYQMEDSGMAKPVHVEWAKYRLNTPAALKARFNRKYSFFDFDEQEELPLF
jgi:replicative DNA helicase